MPIQVNIIVNFAGVCIKGYVYLEAYAYSFCQIFQGLRLFGGLRLLETLEYVYKAISSHVCENIGLGGLNENLKCK